MTKYLTFLNIIIFQSFILGQTITGSVKDRITNGNLDGVNITIQGTAEGTSTDSEGAFTLDISSLSKDQMIKFQHIGYDELTLPFLSELGEKVYNYEFSRKRDIVPDLSRFISQ